GIVKWMRENLFKTRTDIAVTLITLFLIISSLISFFNWALFTAQWEIVFSNLRAHSLGILFPQDEVWRADLIMMIVVGLSLLSVAIWGRLNRFILLTTLTLLAALFLIPAMSEGVRE